MKDFMFYETHLTNISGRNLHKMVNRHPWMNYELCIQIMYSVYFFNFRDFWVFLTQFDINSFK